MPLDPSPAVARLCTPFTPKPRAESTVGQGIDEAVSPDTMPDPTGCGAAATARSPILAGAVASTTVVDPDTVDLGPSIERKRNTAAGCLQVLQVHIITGPGRGQSGQWPHLAEHRRHCAQPFHTAPSVEDRGHGRGLPAADRLNGAGEVEHADEASMRPRRPSCSTGCGTASMRPRRGRSLRAGPPRRGSADVRGGAELQVAGFNEAGACRPRIVDCPRVTAHPTLCFNEAGACRPRIAWVESTTGAVR